MSQTADHWDLAVGMAMPVKDWFDLLTGLQILMDSERRKFAASKGKRQRAQLIDRIARLRRLSAHIAQKAGLDEDLALQVVREE